MRPDSPQATARQPPPRGQHGDVARTAAERRAARKRKEQQRTRRAPRDPGLAAAPTEELRLRNAVAEALEARDEHELERLVDEVAGVDPHFVYQEYVTALLMALLTGLWEHGWQPADIAHVIKREGRARMYRLAVAVIACQASTSLDLSRAPEEWVTQLSALEMPDVAGAETVTRWRIVEGLAGADAWREILRLVNLLGSRGSLPELSPPPSRWSNRTPSHRRPATPHRADTRALGRIRGLLAKAESTEFPDEAEALSAKAQELMTRYAVDEAVLSSDHGERLVELVVARRVHLENPYPEAKLRLLDAVGSVNDVRVIYLESLAIATVVGLPFDLDLVELMFTSLLVQASRAMAAAGRAGDRGTRTPSFRRSFLLSYAQRIRERLTEARDVTTEEEANSRGADLVPVMKERRNAVDEAFGRLFPETYSIQTRTTNARGWHAGRLAAEHADLRAGRTEVTE